MTRRALREGSAEGFCRQLAMPVGFLVWLCSVIVVPYVLTKLGVSETPTVVISMGVFLAPVFLVIALRGGSEREGRTRRSAGPLVCFSMVFFVGAVVASQTVRDDTLWVVLLFVGIFFASMAVPVARSSRRQHDLTTMHMSNLTMVESEPSMPGARWTDKTTRRAARLAWRELPRASRSEVMRLARKRHVHPDRMVRQAAADWAGAWRSEFSPARIAGLVVLGVVAAVGSIMTFKTPILLAALPVAVLAAIFIGVAAVMTNLDRVSRASASVVEARDDDLGSGPQSR